MDAPSVKIPALARRGGPRGAVFGCFSSVPLLLARLILFLVLAALPAFACRAERRQPPN
jgi:hypothetical protein